MKRFELCLCLAYLIVFGNPYINNNDKFGYDLTCPVVVQQKLGFKSNTAPVKNCCYRKQSRRYPTRDLFRDVVVMRFQEQIGFVPGLSAETCLDRIE